MATYDGERLRRVGRRCPRGGRATVSTSPRTIGPVSAASPCGSALSSAAVSSGRSVRGRVLGAGGGQDLHRLGDEGDEVVGAVGETRVVERARAPRAPTSRGRRGRRRATRRAPARRRRRSRRTRSRRGAGRSTSVPVKVIAGCSATARAPTARAGSSTARPCRPLRCARRPGPRGSRRVAPSIGDDVGEHVVGDGQQQQVAGARDVGRLGDAGRRAAASSMRRTRGVGLAGGGDDVVAGGRGARRPARRRHGRRRSRRRRTSGGTPGGGQGRTSCGDLFVSVPWRVPIYCDQHRAYARGFRGGNGTAA